MINAQSPSPGSLVITCTFSCNTTTGMGAGMYSYTYSGSGGYAIVINTTFVGNTGEAVFVNGPGSSIYLVNSIVWGGINILTSGTASIYSSILSAASCHASATCDSGTKFATNPLFVDANGADDIYGTIDDNLRLQDTSPAIDSGNNTVFWIPVDEADLDGDGNRTETIPIDFDGAPRYFDAPPANTGTGTPPIVDMGAFENQTQAMQPLFLPLIMK